MTPQAEKKRRRLWVCRAGLLAIPITVLVVAGLPVGAWLRHHRACQLDADWTFQATEIVEPSAIAFRRPRGSLLVACDNGYVLEVDEGFRRIDRYDIPGDLEGLAIHPQTETLFVAVESFQAILEFDLERRRILRWWDVDLQAHPLLARKPRNDNRGLEGVAIGEGPDPGLRLYAVVESDPALLVRLDVDLSEKATAEARKAAAASGMFGVRGRAAVVEAFDLGVPRLSDVIYDAHTQKLCVLCSDDAVLLVVDTRGKIHTSARLPGGRPEGLVFLPDGRTCVADDTATGLWTSRHYRDRLVAMMPSARTASVAGLDTLLGQTASPRGKRKPDQDPFRSLPNSASP